MDSMKRIIWKYIGLSVLSTVLLVLPWRLPAAGWLLLFAFVPLFWIEADFAENRAKGCWKYYALTFLLWNLFTTYWIYKATLWGGVFAVLANAFLTFCVFALFRWAKKRSGPKIGYIFLIALWIAWEYFYFDAEISWPWLVLGNGFGDTTMLVQWYEYTGVLGGSLWVMLFNILLFWRMRYKPKEAKAGRYLGGSLAALILLPIGLSLYRYYSYREVENPIEVVVLQPNIDPYHEKFEGGAYSLTREAQDERLLELIAQAISPATGYVFAPETFISEPSVVENEWQKNPSLQRFDRFLQHYPQMAMVVGAVSTLFYHSRTEQPTETARRFGVDSWYDNFNTAFQLSAGEAPMIYRKSKLVIGAEKLPYIRYFKFAHSLIIDLGGAMGGFGTQSEASVFPAPWNRHTSDTTPAPLYVGVAICYESVYGEYFASYVKKGAGIMSVITNDGWWGNTPGYRQHLAFSRLRAIETRRSIARSANTGISALIDQRGDYIQKSRWWEESYLVGNLNINHKLTFYVRHGDMIGRISVYLLVLLLFYSLVSVKYRRSAGPDKGTVGQRRRGNKVAQA